MTRRALAQTDPFLTSGILAATPQPGLSLALVDPGTGETRLTFDIGPRPDAAWPMPMSGVALVRSETALSVVNANDGSMLPVAIPQTILPNLLVTSIQFRGSAGQSKVLIGTPNFDADTYLIDLTTGERQAVIGLLTALQPPVSLQNVAVSGNDLWLLAWDGRTTWIVDLTNRTSRTLGVPTVTLQAGQQFTFSAGFNSDGTHLAYSHQLLDGTTELRLQTSDGLNDRQLMASRDILVSLWIPRRDLLLLDARSQSGGLLSVLDPETGNREDLLAYAGATNIVQLTRNGRQALVAIEGGEGRDIYRLDLSLTSPSAQLLTGLAETSIYPGFEFHADWAVAMPPVDLENERAIKVVNVSTGVVRPMITGLTSDAEITGPIIAPNGEAALVQIDSFTELAVHYLRFDQLRDIQVDLMKGGTGVIAPDGRAFAVAADLNTGGTTTLVYDEHGVQGATFQGEALAWI